MVAAVVSVGGVEDCISVMQKIEEVLKRGGHDYIVAWLYQTVRRRQFYTARQTPAGLAGSICDAVH